MPIEDIRTTRAPTDWTPNSDQRRAIAEDARLQRMTRDDQYFYFNKPKTPRPARTGNQPAPSQQRKSSASGTSGGMFGWIDRVTQALKGD